MNIGFIGAGRVGVTLGRYFLAHKTFNNQHKIIGYYDIDKNASMEAAKYTDTHVFTIEELVNRSDIIFITVVDGAIKTVWDCISKYNIEGKIVCHCSGAMSSEVFSNIDKHKAYRYSVHPLFACSSKEDSYKDISGALFTIEGSSKKLDFMKDFIESLGNIVEVITSDCKVKYHAAAVMASNQMLGLMKCACDLLVESGFSPDNALEALKPLIYGNINNAYRQGLASALTGPVARDDKITIDKHINELNGDTKKIYELLTNKLYELKES